MRILWFSFRPRERCLLRAEKHNVKRVATADTFLLSLIFNFPEVDRKCGSGGEMVPMMQAAESWHGYDPATGIGTLRCLTTGGRALRQRKMSSILVVIMDVLIHKASDAVR